MTKTMNHLEIKFEGTPDVSRLEKALSLILSNRGDRAVKVKIQRKGVNENE